MAAALRAGGLRVEAYADHFSLDDVADQEWLRLVGANGWIALTHNKYIRYERDELDELMTRGVKAFFIIGKGPHPAFAAAVLRGLHKIKRLIRQHGSEPFVGRVYQATNDVDVWVSYQQWLEDRRSGKL